MSKQVFSFETDREKDLHAVAEAMALCRVSLEKGCCSPLQCQHCETHKEIELCFNELPACDRLRVKQVAADRSQFWRFRTGEKKTIGDSVKYGASVIAQGVGMAVAIVAGVALFIWVVTWPLFRF